MSFGSAGPGMLLLRTSLAPSFATIRRSVSLKCGLVGLPNVGKSSLFNALCGTTQARAENFPFCTIDPNVASIQVPDKRLDALAALSKSKKILPTTLQFVDIAGLVKGASQGEGLGNQFLANIRECDMIVHVVRAFEDDNVTHVSNTIDSTSDIAVIELELMLSDLAQIERRLSKKTKKPNEDHAALTAARASLNDGISPLKTLTSEQLELLKPLGLLSLKPVLYAINVADTHLGHEHNKQCQNVIEHAQQVGAQCVKVSAQFESELAALSEEEKEAFLEDVGVSNDDTGLNRLETHAWTVVQGARAPQAAGRIHSDFEKHFIKADVINWESLIAHGGFTAAKAKGQVRLEGKEYLVQDGDVIIFMTSA